MLSASLPRCCGLAQSRNCALTGWVLMVVDRTVGCEAGVGVVQRRNAGGWQRSDCYRRDLIRGTICKIRKLNPFACSTVTLYFTRSRGFYQEVFLKIGPPLRFFKAPLPGVVVKYRDALDVVPNPNTGLYLVAHRRIWPGSLVSGNARGDGWPGFWKTGWQFSYPSSARCVRSSRTSSLAWLSLTSNRVSEQFPNS